MSEKTGIMSRFKNKIRESLSDSPLIDERVCFHIISFLLILVCGGLSVNIFGNIFGFIPNVNLQAPEFIERMFSWVNSIHLSFGVNLALGILFGGLTCFFTVIFVARVFCTPKYHNELFRKINCYKEYGCCKAFWYRWVGAHAPDPNDLECGCCLRCFPHKHKPNIPAEPQAVQSILTERKEQH